MAIVLGGCLGTPVASYNWQFRQLRADAADKQSALAQCETYAKGQARRIGAANLQIWTYASRVDSCMRLEGWETIGRPVTVNYV